MTDTPGLDLTAFRAWYDEQRPGEIAGELGGQLIAGGKSNLTYEVTDGTSWWIVRRPPLGHVQATAHDMGREYTAMSALRDTDVPVPTTYAHCADPDVIGAPFYVMERVAGTAYRSARELEELGAERTASIAREMVDVLARLHTVDPEAVGLGEFGRPAGFLERQVRRWGQQLAGSKTTDRAVVDWERATLGVVRTDLALLLVYDRLADLPAAGLVSDVSTAPGYPSGEEHLARYAESRGRDLGDMGFHLGLAYFKLAVILEGINYRFLQGATVGEGFDQIGAGFDPLITAGLAALGED